MPPWPFRSRRKRVFVLGIDGVPHSLLERFLREGRMPKLAALVGSGRLTRMSSCYPTVSNVAWACFQTGRNPGAFDIFGFAELTPTLELRLPNAKDLRAKTIWEMLSENGRRVIGLGVPTTYPPRAVNGVLVGCFLAPKLGEAVYPVSMLPKFESWGYHLDVDPMKARESLDYLKPDLLRCLEGRDRAIRELWDSEEWDLFVTHVMETDRINHFMWKYLHEPETENGKFFLDFYRRIDDLIGMVAARADERTELMILSDHGFCDTVKEVQLNRWLEEKDYLAWDGERRGFSSLCHKSKALALVPGRIHILRKGRWERGSVEDADYEDVRGRIMQDLKEFKDPEKGQPICRDILRREEVYSGPYADHGPDIVVHPHDGYDLKAAIAPGKTFTTSPINGMHTREDAVVFLRGRDISAGSPNILDTAPTLLHVLGLPASAELEGRSLVD